LTALNVGSFERSVARKTIPADSGLHALALIASAFNPVKAANLDIGPRQTCTTTSGSGPVIGLYQCRIERAAQCVIDMASPEVITGAALSGVGLHHSHGRELSRLVTDFHAEAPLSPSGPPGYPVCA
jgi:hypothetical protein